MDAQLPWKKKGGTASWMAAAGALESGDSELEPRLQLLRGHARVSFLPATYGPHVTCALIGMNCNALACARGWHSTPIRAVVRAATGLISKSWPRILRKGCSRYAFFRILSAVKRSTAEIQRSQTVKCLFALRSSGQAAKMTVKISWPRSQLWLRREWECHPLDARPAICNQLQHGYQECGCPSIIIGLIEN